MLRAILINGAFDYTSFDFIYTSRERLRQQDLYADRDSAGDKALVMKQFLSDEKVHIRLINF